MGLIKAAASAIGGTLGDQWEDYITCNELSSDVLIVKKTTKTGQISAKSRIQVNPGQAIIVVDSGRILDVSAEEGVYSFDASTSPSVFAGQFGASLKEVWDRFKFGGQAAKEQVIYYVNIQEELQGNKFGSSTPMPYDDPKYRGVYIRYFGSYTFKVSNPLIFYHNVANDIGDAYDKAKLMEQADGEFCMHIDDAIASLAADGVVYNQLNRKKLEIAKKMNDSLDEEWLQRRGIEVVSVQLDKITPDEDSRKRIEKFDDAAMFGQQEYAAGRMIDATANAMEGAANNANGAANGFMGLGMMNMGMNNMMGGQSPLNFVTPSNQGQPVQSAPQTQEQAPAAPVVPTLTTESTTTGTAEKFCTNCGKPVTGKFCSNCGTAAPADGPKECPKCGATPIDGAKFCVECGSPLN